MFKIMVLQALYGLSDDQTEFQIQVLLSFMRLLGLGSVTGCRTPRRFGSSANNLQKDPVLRGGLILAGGGDGR